MASRNAAMMILWVVIHAFAVLPASSAGSNGPVEAAFAAQVRPRRTFRTMQAAVWFAAVEPLTGTDLHQVFAHLCANMSPLLITAGPCCALHFHRDLSSNRYVEYLAVARPDLYV
jgi:membrane associated rhomboid family serine protease